VFYSRVHTYASIMIALCMYEAKCHIRTSFYQLYTMQQLHSLCEAFVLCRCVQCTSTGH